MMDAWDYTVLAASYNKRAPYSKQVIDEFLRNSGVTSGAKACDIGAGTGNLTLFLLKWGLRVVAVEPNPAMRAIGMPRTKSFPDIRWINARGEATGLPASEFDVVTFGSSFNVLDRNRALVETARILKPKGWFACVWNYRNLDDPLQRKIEEGIHGFVSSYDYGVRREDQTVAIQASGLFDRIVRIDRGFKHRTKVSDCMDAWRSHATLARQAGPKTLGRILEKIECLLTEPGGRDVEVPYTTSLWMAQKSDAWNESPSPAAQRNRSE